MKTEYEYIRFIQLPQPNRKRKTQHWDCRNIKANFTLGYVCWHCAWRQYCFFPCADTVFSTGCLNDINDFISQLMAQRREAKNEEKLEVVR